MLISNTKPSGSTQTTGLRRRNAILAAFTGLAALALRPAKAVAKDAAGAGIAPSHAPHKVAILVASNDDRALGHALAYALNLNEYYTTKNQSIEIELVANGSGIDLFRADRSTMKEPLGLLRAKVPNVVYSICHSSMFNAAAREHHDIPLLPNVGIVPFGIGRIVDLQESGWACIYA